MSKLNSLLGKSLFGFVAMIAIGTSAVGVFKITGSINGGNLMDLLNPKIAQAATGCIITLFGKQYDVVSLQNGHSGGSVFVCGTDMTAVYQAMHGTDVSRMAQYLIPATAPTPTTISTPTPTVIPTITSTPTPTPAQTGLTPTPTQTPNPTPTVTSALPPTNSSDEDEEDGDERK